tara:strand:+ start:2459 stop:2932 length:474 start_codon:yes stop_codon:yes gene_type:complete
MNKENMMAIYNITEKDSELLWNWRNDTETRMMSRNSQIIKWDEHQLWLQNKLNKIDNHLYLVSEKEVPIGVIIFSKIIKNTFEISININPKYRNKGYGNKLLKLALNEFGKDKVTNYKIRATIKKINKKSQRLFHKMMFKLEGSDSDYLYYSLSSKL